jgi:hypothetical protein
MAARGFRPFAGWSLTSDLPLGQTGLALQTVNALSRTAPELYRLPRWVAATKHDRRFPQNDISQASDLPVLPSVTALHSGNHVN